MRSNFFNFRLDFSVGFCYNVRQHLKIMCDPGTAALIATTVFTGAATSAALKKAAPKPPAPPTKISPPPTAISAGEQGKKGMGDEPVDLLSTIISGNERKNKLG